MRNLALTILLLLCWSCDQEVKPEQVFKNLMLTPAELQADGESITWVSVEIDADASDDRRNFIFSTTDGVFTKNQKDTVTVKAEYENQVLIAKTKLRVSTSPGEFTVTVKPTFDSPVTDFSLSKTGRSILSAPVLIKMATSGFGLAANFKSEVFLAATLKNASEKKVSRGIPVLFEDELPSGEKALGRFRALQTTTGDSSKVSAFYAAAAYPIGTTIKIRSTVLSSEGKKTMIKDSLLITINQ